MTGDEHVVVGAFNEPVAVMSRFDFHNSSVGEIIQVITLIAPRLCYWGIDLLTKTRIRHK
jgi:hypothetical protein